MIFGYYQDLFKQLIFLVIYQFGPLGQNLWPRPFSQTRIIKLVLLQLLSGKSEMGDQWPYHMVFLDRAFDFEIKIKVSSSGKKSIFSKCTENAHFFPFHVVEIFFLSIFKAGDPEIRDPRP